MYDTLFLLSTFQLQEVVQFISSSVTFCSLFPCCEERKIDFLKPQCRRMGGRSQRASDGISLPLASLLGDRYQRSGSHLLLVDPLLSERAISLSMLFGYNPKT